MKGGVELCEESCETILDRAIKRLNDLHLSSDEQLFSNCEIAVLDEAAAPAATTSVICEISTDNHANSLNSSASTEGSQCVDLLIQGMTSATYLEDALSHYFKRLRRLSPHGLE